MVAASLALFVVLLVACTPKPASAPAPQAPAVSPAPAKAASATSAVPAKLAWEAEWDRALAEAKKERKVVIYTSNGPRPRLAIQSAFRAAYGVDAEFIAGITAQLDEKVMTEHRAGLHLADVTLVGSTGPIATYKPAGILEPLDDVLILPEVTNPKVWRGGELLWADKDHTLIGFTYSLSGLLTRNTTLVKPEEIKSWRGLLDPKWKNKIVMFDPTLGSGPGANWAQAMGRFIMGWDYMRELAKQEPIIIGDARLQVEWLARGKYPMGTGCRAELVDEFMTLGSPLEETIPSEGVYMTYATGAVSLLKGAPHPNAAKLLINWLLSKEGGAISSRVMAVISARLDVPVLPELAKRSPPPNVTYPNAASEENLLHKAEDTKMLREIFGPLKK